MSRTATSSWRREALPPQVWLAAAPWSALDQLCRRVGAGSDDTREGEKKNSQAAPGRRSVQASRRGGRQPPQAQQGRKGALAMPIRARSSSSRSRCAARNFRPADELADGPLTLAEFRKKYCASRERRGQGREGPQAIRPQDRKHHARNPQHAGLGHGGGRRSRLSRAACHL